MEVSFSKIFLEPQTKVSLTPNPTKNSKIQNNQQTIQNPIREEERRVEELTKEVKEEIREEEIIEEESLIREPALFKPLHSNEEETKMASVIEENFYLPIQNNKGEKEELIVQTALEAEKSISQILPSENPQGTFKNASPSEKEVPLVYPKYAVNPKPLYPREARKRGYEGEVLLKVEVLSNGRVGKIEVKSSSGYEILDRSAIETVKRWKFVSAQKGEERISVWVNIPIKFQLR
ncbi:MAG: energy transducer TonB [Thermodesulfobacteriota bacterium]